MTVDYTYLADLETELSEAYILNDKTRAKYLEKLIAEIMANIED
jgi:hypothetical protein